jgi:iron complex transport system ATP-binding protein
MKDDSGTRSASYTVHMERETSRSGDSAPLELRDVGFDRDGRRIIDTISLRVAADHRWVVLGANGSGKTTLVRIAALYEHPSRGSVWVLGEQLGRTDVRVLRRRIGYSSAALAAQFRGDLAAVDIVKTARFAALEPWWHRYDDHDRQRAIECLATMGVDRYAERQFGSLSSGEQQRVMLARTLMNEPGIVLLDEPSARLDLAGREQLVHALAELAAEPTSPPFILVTHHVDEVPVGITHAMLLRDGRSIAQGPIDDVLTRAALSECFGLALELERRPDGRLSAWARR